MAQNEFKAYIQKRRWSANLRDFVDHAAGDLSLPDPESWEELEAYLEGCDAVEDTIRAAEYIWGLYVADTRGQAG